MRVLVANHKLSTISGSETFTYTLVEELKRRNIEVEYFTFHKGITSNKIEEELKVEFMSKNRYDLILANHNTCVKELYSKGFIIQTCHGIYPKLEQPSIYADAYIAISNEIQNYLSSLGFPSLLVKNGINLNRYVSKKRIQPNIKRILSLCHSDTANSMIKEAISKNNLNIELLEFNKYKNPVWNIEDYINDVDLVIGIGRSLYDAIACGRNVICFDARNDYMDSYGDGYLNENIYGSINYNCSGRFSKKVFTSDDIYNEILKYDVLNGAFLRKFAETELSIITNVDMYLRYFEELKTINNRKIYFEVVKNVFGKKTTKQLLRIINK
ncbi:UDP-glycosyltransferase [Empedobacter brevis]|uniref:UDP-glycosyltransferase n=1 Tax=Empedobacter brevis TaxID=247 RepID=UPI001F36FEA7|nr:UDP-glycosyltransferase [Empedobacter brevis]